MSDQPAAAPHRQPCHLQQPDMLPNGYPQLTVLRTTRARPARIADERDTEPGLTQLKPPRRRWIKPGIGLLTIVLIVMTGWLLWLQAVIPAWNWLQDQWHYGDARITQLDANVGHGGISHFLAEYYQGRIIVVELSLSNPNVFHTYTLGGMIGAEGTPRIVLTLEDQNHDKKPDLLIQVAGTAFTVTLYNTGTTFERKEG